MERLQAAVEKARQASVHMPGRSRRSRADHAVGGRWEALPEMQLNTQALARNRIYTIEATPEAVSFDILRTRTVRFMQQQGWTRLAITSPTPGCGKSTVALNLAFAMARQAGTRTVQIEVDMRQPSQETLLGLPDFIKADEAIYDLPGFFAGSVPFGAVARRCRPGLAVATTGTRVAHAADLLLGAQVGDVLQGVEDLYQPDIMIFDMPPMLANDDTLAFTQHVDCVLVIAAAEHSTAAQIERCERELAEQTNVLGVVLNKCRLSSRTGRYGYDEAYGT